MIQIQSLQLNDDKETIAIKSLAARVIEFAYKDLKGEYIVTPPKKEKHFIDFSAKDFFVTPGGLNYWCDVLGTNPAPIREKALKNIKKNKRD